MCDNTHEHKDGCCGNHSHEHEHEHAHKHEHEHQHGGDAHSHEHQHAHGHNHAHGHTHEQSELSGHEHSHGGESAPGSINENLALLNYMLDHNLHHSEDLHELCHGLEAAGSKEAAALVAEALHFYGHGNEKLAEAQKLLGGQ